MRSKDSVAIQEISLEELRTMMSSLLELQISSSSGIDFIATTLPVPGGCGVPGAPSKTVHIVIIEVFHEDKLMDEWGSVQAKRAEILSEIKETN